MNTEFEEEISPRQYPGGMNTVEARRFLEKEFPKVKEWLCWMQGPMSSAPWIRALAVGRKQKGQIGAWSWNAVECSYPATWYWTGSAREKYVDRNWTGVIRIKKKGTETDFLLFSYLNATGGVGDAYYVSTKDWEAVAEFSQAVREKFSTRPKNFITIDVANGPDITLNPDDDEGMVVDPSLKADIEGQVMSFFENRTEYKRFGLKPKRGMLFCGPPGNGKTLMMRHLIRLAWKSFKPKIVSLKSSRRIEESLFDYTFTMARGKNGGIVILEDMDSLTQESGLTRAAILDQLDGLESNDGILLLGSTNNPELIDPALVDRPSRFDRVFHFELPNEALRLEYLKSRFGTLKAPILKELAEGTAKWSFAYLGELYTTAALLTIRGGKKGITAKTAFEAYNLLKKQVKAGAKNHVKSEEDEVGFRVA